MNLEASNESSTTDNLNDLCTESSLDLNTPLSELRAPAECAICLNNLLPTDNLEVLSCAHTFHSQCILQWILNSRSCPVCRSTVQIPLDCFDQRTIGRPINTYIRRNVPVAVQFTDIDGVTYRETRSSILRRRCATQRRQQLNDNLHSPPNSTVDDHLDLTMRTQMPTNRDRAVSSIFMNQGNEQFGAAEPGRRAFIAALMRYIHGNSQGKIIYHLIFLVPLLLIIFIDDVASQEPVPCAPRKISCLFCNSSKLKGCEDPFPKRDMYLPNLPTVDCYEDCFKWLYIDFQQRHQLIRGCSSQLYLKIDRHLICMHESKGRGGYICFCSSERCNHAHRWAKAGAFHYST
nr:hypothetical transcript [Hymenolepis microstoma]